LREEGADKWDPSASDVKRREREREADDRQVDPEVGRPSARG